MPYSIGMPELPEVHTVVTELNKKLKRPLFFRLDLERLYQLDPPIPTPTVQPEENQ